MADFENPHLKGKSLEELIDMLSGTAEPGSSVHEMIKAAIQVRLAERLATPRRWALIALMAAIVSAGAAVVLAIAAFSGDDPPSAVQARPAVDRERTPTPTPFFEPTPKPGEGFFDSP